MRAIDADTLITQIVTTTEEAFMNASWKQGMTYALGLVETQPTIQPDITYIVLETLHECGIYGEEATIKLIGTLKRIGRDDLIPPCAR